MEILLVEDNEGDVMLVRLAVAEASASAHLHIARDGEQALAMLESKDLRPALIILDLNLPRVPGTVLLERWESRAVPIVVFSSSRNDAERARVLALGACDFIQKPTDLDGFIGAVSGMIQRWAEGREPP